MKNIIETVKKVKISFKKMILKKYFKTTTDVSEIVKEAQKTKFNNRIVGKIARFCVTGLTVTALSTTTAFADNNSGVNANTSSLDNFIDFACSWLVKIGGVVMLVGGVMFALGWQREDAEGKSRGLMTLLAGGMIVAIGGAKNLFGL